jgi:hypothetical protein
LSGRAGLLGQVADGHVGLPLDFAVVFLVDAGHDLQHGGLAGAVQAEQADLGAGEEGQGDVLDDLPLGRDDLADAQHGHDVLGHGVLSRNAKIEGVTLPELSQAASARCPAQATANCSFRRKLQA